MYLKRENKTDKWERERDSNKVSDRESAKRNYDYDDDVNDDDEYNWGCNWEHLRERCNKTNKIR